MSIKEFNRAWEKAIRKLDSDTEKVIRATSIQLFSAIIKSTPVGDPTYWQQDAPLGYVAGTLRGNWQASINAPLMTEVKDRDKAGNATVSKAANAIRNYNAKSTIYFTNNLPYAEKVEDGWSRQRPQGMMKTNIKAFSGIFDKIARRTFR